MKSIQIIFLFILLSFFGNHAYGQSYQGQRNQIFAYNILSNGLMGGIGGVVNKKKGEKALPVFIKNFGKGCLGGLIKYSAKSQTYYLKNLNFTFLAPANRAFYFLGHSVVMNASKNQRTLENYYCNFFGIDFNYKPYAERGDKLNARLSLGTAISVAQFALIGHKLNFYNTLEYGQFYFDMDSSYTRKGKVYDGFATYNTFAIRQLGRGQTAIRSVPHEIVHTFQNYDFFALSSIYGKPLNSFLNKSKTYKSLSKYINFDYQPIFYRALYIAQPKPMYYRNNFEFEAEHFSDRRFIER